MLKISQNNVFLKSCLILNFRQFFLELQTPHVIYGMQNIDPYVTEPAKMDQVSTQNLTTFSNLLGHNYNDLLKLLN